MRGKRQHDVIDEKLVGLIRPTQRLQERRTEMADDLVFVPDADLIGKLINALGAGLFSELSSADRGR